MPPPTSTTDGHVHVEDGLTMGSTGDTGLKFTAHGERLAPWIVNSIPEGVGW